MAIVQISKIQHRSGNIVDLPQLDEAELGFASDAKKLFIGKVSPNENIEVLTSYSNIAFNQIEGAVGNLDISAISIEDGQVLVYDGTNWVNRGGSAGGLIDLGEVGNVKLDGGAIGYVLETDGTGNLSWTPKATLVSYIKNITNASPAVVTTVDENFFVEGAEVTFTNCPGISGSVGYDINGLALYANVITSTTFSLYTDSGLTTPYNASGDTAFPNTTATATAFTGNLLTVGSTAAFSLNDPIKFTGDTFGVLNPDLTYYVKTLPSGTTMTLSLTPGGTTLILTNATVSGTCTVYATGGRVIATAIGAGGSGAAAGSAGSVQYNAAGALAGSADLTWTSGSPSLLNVNGNINVGNINVTSLVNAQTFTSTITTGTPPMVVNSTTRVANLNVSHANVADFINTTLVTTGLFYPVLGNATSGNVIESANANLTFNAATGELSSTLVTAIGNVTGANINTAGNVTGNILISVVTTGTAPLTVTSTTRVANLNVNYANVSDFEVVTTQTTGVFYPVFVNANTTANYALASNANLSFNATTGTLTSTLFAGTLSTAAQPNVTSLGTLTSLTVSGTIFANDISTFGTTGDALNIIGAGNTNVNGAGGNINITAAQGNGTGAGGNLTLSAGVANSAGNAVGGTSRLIAGNGYGQGQGGSVGIYSGDSANTYGAFGGNVVITGGTYDGAGGALTLSAGNAAGQNHLGGNLTIKGGPSTGSAAAGKIIFQTSTPGSSGNTIQVLADRVILNESSVNVLYLLDATSTTSGAVTIAGGLGVAGNIYGNMFYGNGYGLTNINGANITGTITAATSSTTAITVTGNAQPNINSTGILNSLAVDSGTITNITPFTFDQTWNNAAQSFTGIRQNITDTASAASSLLLDLQVNGTGQFYVRKDGRATASTFVSSVLTGTAPLTVSSTTLVGNLNADLLDGYNSSIASAASTVVVRDSNGNIAGATISGTLLTGTLTTAAQPNVTSLGTLTGLNVNGNANVTNTITANILVSNNDVRVGNVASDEWGRFRFEEVNSLYGFTYDNEGVVIITNEELSRHEALVLGDSDSSGTLFGISLLNSAPSGPSTGNEVGWSPRFSVNGVGNVSVVGNILIANARSISGNNLSLTTGANTNPGNITGNWTLTAGSRLQATYADLAEYYEADFNYEPGTVLQFGGEKEVTLAEDATNKVAGVVSSNPAYAMNSECKGIAVTIALQGRVPCKVRGRIRKGDMLISAGTGYARPSSSPLIGTVIGKALENFDGQDGVIEVAVGRL